MRVGLAARAEVPQRRALVDRALAALVEADADVVLQDTLDDVVDGSYEVASLGDMSVDALVTIGGDGTILYALQNTDAPVLGINDGEVGFLTECAPDDLEGAIERLCAGEYFLETRLKLDVTLDGSPLGQCINEVVVKTPRPSKILSFQVTVDGDYVESIRADGMIVATPTGSTSYALSAGGPLIDPRLEAMLLVALAPFRLSARPLVVPSRVEITIVQEAEGKEAVLALDGQVEAPVPAGAELVVTGSKERARFVRFRPHFLTRVRELLQ